jgi:hypothetical protein
MYMVTEGMLDVVMHGHLVTLLVCGRKNEKSDSECDNNERREDAYNCQTPGIAKAGFAALSVCNWLGNLLIHLFSSRVRE